MTEEPKQSLMLSTEEIEQPSTAGGVLEVLKRVLSKPYVQSISINVGSPIKVVWYKDISDSLDFGEAEETPDFVLSRIDLEEFSTSRSPKETIADAVFYLNQQFLSATHIFVGSVQFFKNWVGVPSVVAFPKKEGTEYFNYLNMSLLEVGSLGEDVVVILASETAEASRSELCKALKIVT